MAIWKEGRFLSWYAELGNGLNLSVFYNPRKLDPNRPHEAQVFGYHTTRAATREEAQQAAEGIAREVLSQALAVLDAKDDEKDGETMSNETTQYTPADVRERRAVRLLGLAMERAEWLCRDAGRVEWPLSDFSRDMLQERLNTVRDLIGDALAALRSEAQGEDTIPVSALRSEIAQLKARGLLPYLAWARLCALAGGGPVGEDTPAALRSEAQGEAEPMAWRVEYRRKLES